MFGLGGSIDLDAASTHRLWLWGSCVFKQEQFSEKCRRTYFCLDGSQRRPSKVPKTRDVARSSAACAVLGASTMSQLM